MTLLALLAIICFGFATYNLTCAFVDIPTKKTSRMMMLARKQQGIKAEKLLDVYTTKIARLLAPGSGSAPSRRTKAASFSQSRPSQK